MSTPAITSHYAHLKHLGIDLGPAQGAEQDGGYGGRFQVYKKGRIYWHPSTGAHHLRGQILARYLQAGGHDANPATGERELGFPASDHEFTADGQAVAARFEWGTIVETPGTALVRLFGRAYTAWIAEGGVLGRLGYPLDDVARVAGGRAAWFERGVVWHAEGSADALVGELVVPTLGHPVLVDHEEPGSFEWFRFDGATAALEANPGLAAALVAGRYALLAVGVAAKPIPLQPAAATVARGGARWLALLMPGSAGAADAGDSGGLHLPGRNVDLGAVADGLLVSDGTAVPAPSGPAPLPGDKLMRRQLYSLGFLTHGLAPRVVSGHCLYARSDWKTFGVAHVSDLHVSRRIDTYRSVLRQRGVGESDVAQLNNWNDCFRAFIRYANHLHAAGLLDVIMATGDLVDYAREVNDHPDGPGNFSFFAALVQGEAKGPDAESVPSEPLRVPMFTSLGNHDYRQLPYPLGFQVSVKSADVGSSILGHIPGVGGLLSDAFDFVTDAVSKLPGLGLIEGVDPVDIIVGALVDPIWNYAGLNVTRAEAKMLMGLTTDGKHFGVPALRPDDAARSVTVEPRLKDGSHWYFRHINPQRSYSVRLGMHRLVMLDTRWDAGIATDVIDTLLTKANLASESNANFVGGSPDSIGITSDDLSRVRNALAEAGAAGVVIVGMHAPPMNPKGTDLSNCLRETAHPGVAPEQMLAWLLRADGLMLTYPALHPSWPRTGTPHFSAGKVEELLDYGIAIGQQESFARLLAGEGAARPVTLLVSGHGHTRVEYRLRLADGKLLTHTDHYLQNPAEYYPTRVAGGNWRDKDSHVRLLVKVQAGAPEQGAAATVRDHRGGTAWPEYAEMRVAPYAEPLDAATDKPGWWAAHAPVVVQTAALGPCTNTRPDPETNSDVPGPNFHGLRLLQVENDVIARVQYVGTPALKAGHFPLEWEPNSLRDELLEHIREHAHDVLVDMAQPGETHVPVGEQPVHRPHVPRGTVRDHRTH